MQATTTTLTELEQAAAATRRAVQDARDALRAAEQEAEQASRALHARHNDDRLRVALVNEHQLEAPAFMGVADYILPVGKWDGHNGKVVADQPATYPFGGERWCRDSVAYIMAKPERSRPTRVFFSGGGNVGKSWYIGATWDCRHDQTGARLGTYTVVGLVFFDSEGQVAKTEGEVPTQQCSIAVFK